MGLVRRGVIVCGGFKHPKEKTWCVTPCQTESDMAGARA
eukprot:COSAG01_NODE_19530_length_1004_cov_14.342541_1_plen_38_part_10